MAEESTALDELHHMETLCLTFVYGQLKTPDHKALRLEFNHKEDIFNV